MWGEPENFQWWSKDHVLILEDKNATLETENNKWLDPHFKRKELAANIQEKLEGKLNKVKTDFLVECEKARVIQENLN